MRLASVKPDDVILVDHGGRLVYGLVTAVGERELEYDPLTRGTTWRHANARQVVGHWRRANVRRKS